ncbi:MAG: hypothetical protein AB1817_04980 [Chloroflexota bacterium]
MDHYLLQNWLAWWQSNGLALANALNSFEKNALSAFWRDIGNLITGAGAGWAATRDSVYNLFGVELPTRQPQSGGDAVRDTVSSFVHQIFEGMFGGDSGSTAPSGSSSATPDSNFTQPPLSDLLPSDMGGKTTLADVVAAAKNQSGN